MRESCRTMTRHSSDSPLPTPHSEIAEKAPSFSKPKRARAPRPLPDFSRERALLDGCARHVVGLDEVGRGPLAGPVVAAAVILDPNAIPDGLDDSKRIKAHERERLCNALFQTAIVAVAAVSADEIDRLDIRQASLLAMRRAFHSLSIIPTVALVDGRDIPDGLNCEARAIIGGDGLSVSIAAASIVAKVTRDRMMLRADQLHPGYGFTSHMGYGTKTHLEAIRRLGPSPLHRMSFAPLKSMTAR
ncbi:RNase HII [Fulvimarina manganoxydans]|uniref:Ribonuclease HII n=1 Tax=Fulvimarina manganoxydans TaxID=937218 RepID=A0A1W2D8I2_9HYPH|nr:ribonuclease HII [Fulvimarina manganoxydans]SMC93693.1 RNase HII [Fulvimarina manganoxydans]